MVEECRVAQDLFRAHVPHRPHDIAGSEMNPGALNAMAEEIIREYGAPDAISYWRPAISTPCVLALAGGFLPLFYPVLIFLEQQKKMGFEWWM